MPMREAVSGNEEHLHSTERSLLGTLAGVLSAVPDYLFAWLVEPDEEAVPLFESRRLSHTVGRSVPLGPLDLLRASVDPAESDRLEDLIRAMTDGRDEVGDDLLVIRDDGEMHQISISAVCAPEPDGGVRVEGVIRDLGRVEPKSDALQSEIQEHEATQLVLEDMNRQLEELSETDHLTGAKNRRHFMKTLRAELERSDRLGPPAVLLLDLDRFKCINDIYGHLAGDTVLTAVAERLRGAIREGDTVARYGGEEFVVLLPEVPDEATLEWRAETIRASLAVTPVLLAGGTELTVTASCGAAVLAETATDEALLDAADRALYAAKRGGRNRTRLASSLTAEELVEEPEVFQLAQGLAFAITIREASPENHCKEVADLSGRIAAKLGLSETVVLRCRLGGWLHDIGKLAISDRVLQDAVTSEEARAVLRTHVDRGAELVGRLTALGDAVAAVRHHHERYDGGGYPDGLAGDEIPIDARIVAAADAWSAMTTGRAYQVALDRDQALDQLRASAGRSLDPDVVAALSAVVTEIREVTSTPEVTSGRRDRRPRVERRSEAA
jgi:diguanylate cyclase (GGDEF)-like protein/putative nucleotidyltransferase with HDIG domain